MSTVHFNWVGGPGDWNDPANWEHGTPSPPNPVREVPGTHDTVSIPASAGTVTVGNGVCRSLNLSADLVVGLLQINYHDGGGTLTLNDATVTVSGFLNFHNLGHNAHTFTIGGNGTIQAQANGLQNIGVGGFENSLVVRENVTIRATTGGTSLTIRAAKFTNFGTLVSDAPTVSGGVVVDDPPGGLESPLSSFINLGTIRSSNGGIVRIGGTGSTNRLTWQNRGELEIDGGTFVAAGRWKQSDLGNYTRINGGIIRMGGRFTGNLTLDDHSGSWTFIGGTMVGSRYTKTGSNNLTLAGGSIDRCTFANDVTLNAGTTVTVVNGLTLENVTIHHGGAILAFSGSQSVGGSGQIIAGGGQITLPVASQTLTIDTGIVVRSGAGDPSIAGPSSTRLIIKGEVAATTSGRTMSINTGFCDVFGLLRVGSGARLTLNSALDIKAGGVLLASSRGTISSNKDITGETTNASRNRLGAISNLTGGTGAAPPQLLEAMSRDRGAVTEGYRDNFALGRISISGNAGVKLQDASDNAQGSDPEVVYVDSLVVPTGATLDLNGLTLYARATNISGTITGGTVSMLSDSGPILYATPTSGRITVANEQDEWTFFGRAGQTVSSTLVAAGPGTAGSPGPLNPALTAGKFTLLNPDGTVLASAQTSGFVAALTDQVLPVNGTYKIRVEGQSSSNTGFYILSLYDATITTRSYLLNTTASGNIETPFARDAWTFSLQAGQQVQFDLIAATTSGLQFTLAGPGGFIAFEDITDDSAVITVPGGGSGRYTLTVKGASDQTGAYSFMVRDSSVTPLALGVPFAGQLPGSGHSRWFQVNLPHPGQLLVTLDDANNGNRNQLYLRQGQLPTRSEFDFRATGFAADGTIYVPSAAAGDWFILVYGDSVPTPSTYTLTAEFSDLRITSITPDRYGVDNQMTMTLSGGGFEPGTTVKLAGGATTIDASSVEIDSFTQVTATFDLSGAPQRLWNVVVERGAADFTLTSAFRTLENTPARLDTKLIMPGNATRTSVSQIILEYANTGNVAMPAPIFTVLSNDPEGDQISILSLDLTRTLEDFNSSVFPPGVSERVMALGSGAVPGVLNPGERMRLPINYLGDRPPFETTDGLLELQVKCAGVAGGEGEDCGCTSIDSEGSIDWGALKDALKPATVTSAVWDRVYSDITDPLDTVQDYAAMLIANAKYLGRIGVRVVDIDELWNMEVRHALGTFTAVPVLAAAIDASVVAPGEPLTLSRRFDDSIVSRNEEGPFGFGWAAPWFATLSRGPNDDVLTLNGSAGSQRTFVRDNRGSTILSLSPRYFSGAGDSSSMRRVSAGIFELREPDGTVTRFTVNGKIDYIDDPRGNRVTLGYNGAGELVTLTHASGATISIGYNTAGRITTVVDSFGRSTAYTYDAANQHLLSATADDGKSVSYVYDLSSDVMRRHTLLSITAGGTTRTFTYDSRGWLANTSLAGNVSPVSFAYSDGRITLTDPAGSNQVFYDHRGRVAKVTDARGFSALAEYDKNDRIIRNTRSDGSTGRYEWCDCGSLNSFTDELGRTTTYTNAGPFKEITQVSDPKGNVSRFTYDSAGNIVSTIFADGSAEALGNYTSSGLPQLYTNRRGQETTFAYNALGQITRRTRPNGQFMDYVYDLRGRIDSVQDNGLNTVFSYDTAIDGDRLERIDYPTGQFIEYDYDSFGRRTLIRDHTGYETRYNFDPAGRVVDVRDASNAVLATYSYDAASRMSRVDRSNNTFTRYGYDAAGNVLAIDNFRSPGNRNSFFHYTYDSRGRRVSQSSADGVWTFGYDAGGQLISANLASVNGSIPNQSIQITYDAAGNREFMTRNGELIDYGRNELNQITSIGGVLQFYDADGNLTFDGQTTFTYDEFNRLTTIDDGVDATQFSYDSLDQINATVINGVTTGYLRDPFGVGAPLIEYDNLGAVAARNIYAGGLLARTNAAGDTRSFYDYDALGSTAGITNAAGSYVNSYAFDPFGQVLARTESLPNPFEFIGQFGVTQQQGGFSHMSARLYNAETSRFTSIDPIRFAADTNVYQYAFNAPTTFIDPSGLIPGVAPGAGFFNGLGPVGELVGGDYSGGVTDQIAGDGGFDPIGLIFEPFDPLGKIPLPGADYAINLMFDERVQPDFINGLCGIARAQAFGTFNASQAKQLLALDPSLGAKASSVDASCLKGFPGSEDRDFGLGNPCATGIARLVHSVDPNDKVAPVGFGPENRVAIEEPILYTIDFENIGPGSVDDNGDPFPTFATAPAQRIIIADQLASHFDSSSVRFTEFSFGETIIPVTDGFGSFHTTVPMFSEGVGFVVQIDAEVDPLTGILAVIFQAIEPGTGLPPNPLSGVLPPEDGTRNGMGYFKFSVQAMPTVPDGTEIRNVALIQFDGNDVIATNQVNPLDPSQGTDPVREALVTIDALPPSVLAGPTFVVDAPTPRVTIQFSEDVGDSLSIDDVVIQNLTQGGTITPVGFSYDDATNTATFDLGVNLPDADFQLELPRLNVADGVGHHPAEDITLDFFFLRGDANRDGRVNLQDFNILAGNFGQSPRSFTQGDFNYDGVVNLADFNILASRFGQALFAGAFGSKLIGAIDDSDDRGQILEELT